MIGITINIEGMERLKEAMQKAPEMTVNEMSFAVRKGALIYKSQALKEAPVNKQPGGGNLRQNIKERFTNKLRAEVTSFAPYSLYVEGGTKPHIIKAVNKKVLANKRMGQIFGKIVHHPGTRANPYMARAVEKTQAQITQLFQTAIKNVFNSLK
jgi:HK97 gp10 family phage protein